MTKSLRVSGSYVVVLTAAQLEAILRETGRLPKLKASRGVWDTKRADSLRRGMDVLVEAWEKELDARFDDRVVPAVFVPKSGGESDVLHDPA